MGYDETGIVPNTYINEENCAKCGEIVDDNHCVECILHKEEARKHVFLCQKCAERLEFKGEGKRVL